MTSRHSPNRHAPIVVIGMHRSGTTLVTRMLMELGVFMGAARDRYGESRFHQHVNRQLMLAAGATWATPEVFVSAASASGYQAWAERTIRRWLDSAAYRSLYVGWWRGRSSPPSPHGFKDPRTTFTLPFWQAACGPVRIVHVLRHGLDVARSLADRQRDEAQSGRWVMPPRGVVRASQLRLTDGVAFGLENIDTGLTLWERYVVQARLALASSEMPVCEVRFEEAVTAPAQVLDSLVVRLGLAARVPAARVVRRLDIDPARARAYREQPATVDLDAARPALARYGYEP